MYHTNRSHREPERDWLSPGRAEPAYEISVRFKRSEAA
jgi:hypothetical protein